MMRTASALLLTLQIAACAPVIADPVVTDHVEVELQLADSIHILLIIDDTDDSRSNGVLDNGSGTLFLGLARDGLPFRIGVASVFAPDDPTHTAFTGEITTAETENATFKPAIRSRPNRTGQEPRVRKVIQHVLTGADADLLWGVQPGTLHVVVVSDYDDTTTAEEASIAETVDLLERQPYGASLWMNIPKRDGCDAHYVLEPTPEHHRLIDAYGGHWYAQCGTIGDSAPMLYDLIDAPPGRQNQADVVLPHDPLPGTVRAVAERGPVRWTVPAAQVAVVGRQVHVGAPLDGALQVIVEYEYQTGLEE